MPGTRPLYHLVHVDWPSETGIQGPEPLIEVAAKSAKLINIADEFTADLLLICFRKLLGSSYGLVEDSYRHSPF